MCPWRLELVWEDSNRVFVQLLVTLSFCCHGLGHTSTSRDTWEVPRGHRPIAEAAVSSHGAVAPRGAASSDSGEVVEEIREGKKVQERMEMHGNCCLLPGTKASENPTGWDHLLSCVSGCYPPPFPFPRAPRCSRKEQSWRWGCTATKCQGAVTSICAAHRNHTPCGPDF